MVLQPGGAAPAGPARTPVLAGWSPKARAGALQRAPAGLRPSRTLLVLLTYRSCYRPALPAPPAPPSTRRTGTKFKFKFSNSTPAYADAIATGGAPYNHILKYLLTCLPAVLLAPVLAVVLNLVCMVGTILFF
eukprot:SAG31_NODE_3254_length_4489_cov_1.441002_1_plen_133_part_00